MIKISSHSKNALTSSIGRIEEGVSQLGSEISSLSDIIAMDSSELDILEQRIQKLAKKKGIVIESQENTETVTIETETTNEHPSKMKDIQFFDELSPVDIAIICTAGGLGVLVDFLVVKIPKSTNIVRNKELSHQEGSPLTSILRGIGFDKEGKTSNWVKVLEKWFKVNYDRSIIPGEKGFCPRTHRLYNLAHDPSPAGFLWALKDAISGTMTYIDNAGILKSIPTTKCTPFKILAMPIIWIGHIISDIFTKVGIPVPGSCLLRTLQFGSFGEKGRTIGQVVEYMYLERYDLRHFVTMSSVNAVIELVICIYYILTKPKVAQFARPAALIEADKAMIATRLQKMRFYSYAIAVGGNTAKLAAYRWNPLALNTPVWIEFLRLSVAEIERRKSTDNDVLKAIKLRQTIDKGYDNLETRIKDL